jgi:hypothetical protein
MTAADTIVPATKAARVAKVSSRLSTTGMMWAQRLNQRFALPNWP